MTQNELFWPIFWPTIVKMTQFFLFGIPLSRMSKMMCNITICLDKMSKTSVFGPKFETLIFLGLFVREAVKHNENELELQNQH